MAEAVSEGAAVALVRTVCRFPDLSAKDLSAVVSMEHRSKLLVCGVSRRLVAGLASVDAVDLVSARCCSLCCRLEGHVVAGQPPFVG